MRARHRDPDCGTCVGEARQALNSLSMWTISVSAMKSSVVGMRLLGEALTGTVWEHFLVKAASGGELKASGQILMRSKDLLVRSELR